ncbi:hypothetical protein [Idiomarina sp.]|uniref:hypothetical protein n=1 Tax=Idiomarina sp. TaxID=1874361 RepID=UPI003A8E6EDF
MNWTLSAFFYFYFVFVGICYLLGFWFPLHFNILEFLSPIDMIKSATYPVIPAALGILFFVLIDSYNSQGTRKPEYDEPKAIKVIFGVIVALFLLMFLINIMFLATHLYYLFISEPEERLSYALPVASVVSIFYFLSHPPFLVNSHKFIRNFVIIFTCILPTVSYFQGSKSIMEVLEGDSNFYYLKSSSENCLVDKESKMIYLGYYGSNYFFVNSKSKDICIEKDGGVLLSFSGKIKSSLDNDEAEIRGEGKNQPTVENGS